MTRFATLRARLTAVAAVVVLAALAAGSEEAVFEPGARQEPADGHGGAGLGLALARRLARAVGGDVRAEHAGASGARFVVELPS